MADEEAATTQTTTRKCNCSCCDFLWIVTTVEGWVKLVEAILTFLTFVIVASFPGSYKAEYEFLIFVGTTAFVFVVLHIILRMTHLFEKLPPALLHPVIGLVCCFVASLALLIGSAVVYAKGDEYNFDTLEVSGICGFLSAFLFLCEGIYFVIRYRRAPKPDKKQVPTEDVQGDDFVQPSNAEY